MAGAQRVLKRDAEYHFDARSGGTLKVQAILRKRRSAPRPSNKDAHNSRNVNNISTIQMKGNIASMKNPRCASESISFKFDACYDEDCSQIRVFADSVLPILEGCLRGGCNASIFAYGCTGAGKTFTMQGTASAPGMIPLSVQYLIEADDVLGNISISFYEIYRERIRDLLKSGNKMTIDENDDLPVREQSNGQIIIPALTQHSISNIHDFHRLWSRGTAMRATAATHLNEHSSRSHACLTITLTNKQTQNTHKLHMIDLAGSEDNRKTANTGTRMIESGAINKSLFVLGKVVDALERGDARIPYRDSKLTRILSDSLGGNSAALLIACVLDGGGEAGAGGAEMGSDASSLATLNFASKCRQIENYIPSPHKAISHKERVDSEDEDDDDIYTGSSPATISSTSTAGKNKRKAHQQPSGKNENPFNSTHTNNHNKRLQDALMEQQIEAKVAQKLRELGKGTFLSPLLKKQKRLIHSQNGIPHGAGRGEYNNNCQQQQTPLLHKISKMKQAVKNKHSLADDPSLSTLLATLAPQLISIFNYGTIREITQLQEIGKKRAESIVVHRPFGELDDVVGRGVVSLKVMRKIIVANSVGIVKEVGSISVASNGSHKSNSNYNDGSAALTRKENASSINSTTTHGHDKRDPLHDKENDEAPKNTPHKQSPTNTNSFLNKLNDQSLINTNDHSQIKDNQPIINTFRRAHSVNFSDDDDPFDNSTAHHNTDDAMALERFRIDDENPATTNRPLDNDAGKQENIFPTDAITESDRSSLLVCPKPSRAWVLPSSPTSYINDHL